MLLSYVKSALMTFAEPKFTLEKWHKGEFDVGQNDIKWGIAVLDYPVMTA